jgi:hypothetical protein
VTVASRIDREWERPESTSIGRQLRDFVAISWRRTRYFIARSNYQGASLQPGKPKQGITVSVDLEMMADHWREHDRLRSGLTKAGHQRQTGSGCQRPDPHEERLARDVRAGPVRSIPERATS